ncbi:MAG TPA: hypothetical protein VHQ70_11210 [Syntrophomonadaceae bacterium]|nr:hypothetical protein [Syntrophomonadaceae bacterium]
MKHYIKSIVFTFFLSICLILFLNFNCSAAETLSSGTSSPAADLSSAELIPPQDSGLIICRPSAKGGTVTSQGGFFFYSNNPEYIYDCALADHGYWLNRAEVSGNGQVYIWHSNGLDRTIKSVLSISNPNSSSILIESNQYGLTNGLHCSDADAWNSYLTANQTGISLEVKPGQTVQLFKQSVEPNNNFGVVAAINITDLNGKPAKAVLKDIAYRFESMGTFKYAGSDGSSRNRGAGSCYQNTITFNPVALTGNNYFAYSLGSVNDSLDGKDLLKIKDGSNNTESLIAGNYGQIMTINIPIKNNYRADQNFGIFIGSIGGYSYPFVQLKETSFVSSPVKPFTSRNMIQSGKIDFGSAKTVSFNLVIPALSSTPLIIGVHPIN